MTGTPPAVGTPLVTRTLDNGLRIVVSEDHLTPLVTVNLWYDVGSRHEEPGRTGFAHLFEHLMFEGSRNVASSEHFGALQEVGAVLNATTANDRTNYFETVPSNALELALWLEADRMATLREAVTLESLDNQRAVVKNERRQRYDNQPYGAAFLRLFELLFPVGHPYHHSPIGSMEDLDAASLDDVHRFHERHYSPDNAVLTIVGDVEPDTTIALVERYFGVIPNGPARPPARDGRLGPLEASVHEVVQEVVPLDALYLGYRLPPNGTPESDALALALEILTGGEGSTLNKAVTRDRRLAQRVTAAMGGLVGGVDLAVLTMQATAGQLDALLPAVDIELRRLADEGPTEDQLTRARARLERAHLASTNSITGRADALNRMATLFGDPALLDEIVPNRARVTATDVRIAVSRWLADAERVVLEYHATATPTPTTAAAAAQETTR